MEQGQVIIQNIADVEASHVNRHEKYEYYRKHLVPYREGGQCSISVYEIPPGKAAYPYHYHTMNEESFYILRGNGRLTTPEGDRMVSAGDFIFFSVGEKGAHILTNASDSETLEYLDFDTHNPIEVLGYPLTGKIGVWDKGGNQVFRTADRVDYYEGE